MSKHRIRVQRVKSKSSGQALVEYALILVLVAVALGVALAATGPAIGNVFSNQIFNLLGEDGDAITGDIQDLGGADNFWLTVTAVAQNPPGEVPFPTNVPVSPPPTATTGPSPTPSETFTATPVSPTPTPTLTPTPEDIIHDAPFLDVADNPDWYRLNSDVFTGFDLWSAEFFPNKELSGSPVAAPDFTPISDINFDWGNGKPIAALPSSDNFSIRFTRVLNLSQEETIKFTTAADDGVRLWIDYSPGCAGVNSGGPATGSRTTFATGCLLIDNWRNQGTNAMSVSRTLPAGSYTLQLDYFENSGGADVSLTFENGSGNVADDALLDNNYTAVGNAVDCTWTQRADGQISSDRPSNSESNMWDENLRDDFGNNARCHLELRGAVNLAALTTPRMAFWDVWDFGVNVGTRTWLEVARYDPTNPTAPVDWSTANRIQLSNGNTVNYAWSYHEVDLNALGFTPADHVTYRFMIESNDATSNRFDDNRRRVWWIDDVYIFDASETVRMFSYCQIDRIACQSSATRGYWDLNDISQKSDFITSGRWALASDITKGGMSFDDSPNRNYDRASSDQNTDRVHSIEFAGWINLTDIDATGGGGVPDDEGDQGLPQLSFWHAYDLDRGELIRLEYTFDPRDADTTPAVWQVVPGADFVPDDNQVHQNFSMQFVEVPLNNIPNWNTTPFRLRFALYVDASRENAGWWIDEIHINRVGVPDFMPYPFCDDVEGAFTDEWLPGGSWARTTESFRPFNGGSHSYTDSPGGDYRHGSNDSLQFRHPLDLNNDTAANFDPANMRNGNENGCDGVGGMGSGTAATNPVLSFYHWRDLGNGDHIFVDYSNDDGQTWNTLWRYSNSSSNRRQLAWERVEIDLSMLQNGTAGGPDDDDDVLIRIRLDARSDSRVSDGIYIDDIRIEDRVEEVHKLWPNSRNDATYGRGDGKTFTDSIDTPVDWWNRWYVGGSWDVTPINVGDTDGDGTDDFFNDSHSGSAAFVDSPPAGALMPPRSFSIIEMKTIIDLSAVDASDNPMMFFWSHFDTADNDFLAVQIAPEDTAQTTQNYDQLRGWANWVTTNSSSRRGVSTNFDGREWRRTDTWQRYQVDLTEFVGKRIRVRFVVNTLNGSTRNRTANPGDGWFIDDIRFTFHNPRIFALPFSDPASNTDNWVTEGLWGLDVEKFRGSGGGPASLGFNPYFGYFIDCPSSCGPTEAGNLLDGIPDGTEPSYNATEMVTEVVLDINHNFGSSRRPAGSTTRMRDSYVGRWLRDITIQEGDFTFITRSDDGVRVKIDAPIGPADGALPGEWNIYEDWTNHAPTTAEATVHLPAGNWQLVVEWFENSGGATIIMSVGKNNFSFSDSPKVVLAPGADVPVVPYSNSSMILDGVLDLTVAGLVDPRIVYYEYRDHDDEDGRFEVSANGGFSWTQSGLDPDSTTDSPNAGAGQWLPSNGPWLEQVHTFRDYVGTFLVIRFRQDAVGEPASDVDDGWWVTDILVTQ